MTLEDLAALSRRDRVRVAVVVAFVLAAIAWMILQFMQPAPPRRIVVATGPASGTYHVHAERYKALVRRELDARMPSATAEIRSQVTRRTR